MSRRAYLYFILTFLLGFVVGGASLSTYWWYWGPRHRGFDKERIVRRMTRELDLTDPQVQQLNVIMDDSIKKFRELRTQVDPQFQALHKEGTNRIRAILTPEQLPKFNQMVRRFEQRMKRERRP